MTGRSETCQRLLCGRVALSAFQVSAACNSDLRNSHTRRSRVWPGLEAEDARARLCDDGRRRDSAPRRRRPGSTPSRWPGTRVLKFAVANRLAWWAGTRLGDPAPMFAAFAALNGMQPTVAVSLRNTSGALLGIVLGSGLAVASETLVDAPRSIRVALLVALGLPTALRLHAYALLGTECVFRRARGHPAC